MLIGVISDTHGHTHRTLDAIRILESFSIEALLHCGDIGSPQIPPLITAWPAHFVLGNVDEPDEEALRWAITAAGHQLHGLLADLELGGRTIAVTHGHYQRLLDNAIQDGRYDLVCYGHTHQADQRRLGSTQLLNPGALYRARIPSCAVVDLKRLAIEILPIG